MPYDVRGVMVQPKLQFRLDAPPRDFYGYRSTLGFGMANNSTPIFVLLSGGIDSTACVAFFALQGFPVSALFIDYGQAAAPRETDAASAVASHYRIPLSKIRCTGARKKGQGLIAGRNAFLISLASMELESNCGMLSLGLHSGTDYWDCSPEFANLMQTMLDGYSNGRVRLNFPFLNWTKREVWHFALTKNAPLDLTYSCELGADQPCDSCQTCGDIRKLRAS